MTIKESIMADIEKMELEKLKLLRRMEYHSTIPFDKRILANDINWSPDKRDEIVDKYHLTCVKIRILKESLKEWDFE